MNEIVVVVAILKRLLDYPRAFYCMGAQINICAQLISGAVMSPDPPGPLTLCATQLRRRLTFFLRATLRYPTWAED